MYKLAQLADLNLSSKASIASSDWWAGQFANFAPENIALALLFSLISSVIIAMVYKRTYRGVLYNPSFSVTLILLTLITSPVVMAIGSNVALSMGMVGALSIVRFRTAVKDPIDTAYMFWAITMGILIGSGSYIISLVVVLGISFIMLGISFIKLRSSDNCWCCTTTPAPSRRSTQSCTAACATTACAPRHSPARALR